MIVLCVTLRVRAPWCHSLKDKRSLVRQLTSALTKRFHLSCAESGLQDVHDQIELTLAQLAFDAAQAERMQEEYLRFVEGATEAEVFSWEVEYR